MNGQADSTVLTSKATVTILLNDLNDAPTFATPTLNVSKAENNLANAAVVTVKATDGDTLDAVTQPLTYSLLSVINGDGMDVTGIFAINATTGVVTVIPAKRHIDVNDQCDKRLDRSGLRLKSTRSNQQSTWIYPALAIVILNCHR